jgi:hypothetical protein
MLGSRSPLSETEERLAAEPRCGGWRALRWGDGLAVPRATKEYDVEGVGARRLDGDG